MTHATIGMNEYVGHFKQYRLFVDTARFICEDLSIRYKDIKIDTAESDRGSTYYAHLEGELTLDFSLDTFVKANKIQETRVYINIEYEKGSSSFYDSADIGEHVNENGYLRRWATQAIHDFNIKHHPVNLDARFGTVEIRVYGTYPDPILALKEMRLLVNGMQFAKMDKPIVYKFRHVAGLMRKYSYCIFVSDGFAPNFWAFFHNMGGRDSGGHNISRKRIMDMIASNIAVDLRCVDIEYDKLHKFLSEHVTTFNRVERNTLSFAVNHVLDNFNASFSDAYSIFLKSFNDGKYSRALYDLRALLQTAMEIVCEKRGVSIHDKRTIRNLCSRLVENGVLDEKRTAWYCAFSSVTDLPAREGFSIINDPLDQNTKDWVKMAILLGVQLVNELGSVMYYTFNIGGRRFKATSAISALMQILEYLLQTDKMLLKKFAALEHDKKYKYISQDLAKLYPTPSLAGSKPVMEIPSAPGWWIGANYDVETIKHIAALTKKAADPKIRHTMVGDIFGPHPSAPKHPKHTNLVTDGGLTIPQTENAENEFKSSFCYDHMAAKHEKDENHDLAQKQREQVRKNNRGHGLEWDVAKAVAGFSNSTIKKGRIWVGIREGKGQTPVVLGLREDVKKSKSKNMDDDFGNWITDLLKGCIRDYTSFDNVKILYPRVCDEQICVLEIARGSEPMFLFAKGNHDDTMFYKRNKSAPRTDLLSAANMHKYTLSRFKS